MCYGTLTQSNERRNCVVWPVLHHTWQISRSANILLKKQSKHFMNTTHKLELIYTCIIVGRDIRTLISLERTGFMIYTSIFVVACQISRLISAQGNFLWSNFIHNIIQTWWKIIKHCAYVEESSTWSKGTIYVGFANGLGLVVSETTHLCIVDHAPANVVIPLKIYS